MFHKSQRVDFWFRPLDLVNYPLFSDCGFEKTMGFQQVTKPEINELLDATAVQQSKTTI